MIGRNRPGVTILPSPERVALRRAMTGHNRPGVTILPTPERVALLPSHRGPFSLGACAAVLALGIALASGCAVAITPEQAAEGALRARLSADVAPDSYRSGVLPPELAEAWRSRVANELGTWYSESLMRSHLGGTNNVTASLMEQPGPIVTSVDVLRLHMPPASIEGDSARIEGAAIEYTTHFAPGTWNEAHVEGTTMCRFDVRRLDARWLIVDEACNVSGG
jgi:hypothetical protein